MLASFVLFSLLFAGKIVCDDFEELEDDEDEEAFAENYLRQYHYLSPTRSGNHDKTTAIKNFQKFFGLPQTGELDEETLYQMSKPRCGDPDVDDTGGRFKRFATNGKWSKKSLTYYMEYGNDMSDEKQLDIITKAFSKWWAWAPSLEFTNTNNINADLRISFGSGNHSGVTGEPQCGYKFDGQWNVLAHAYYPSDGRIHFDDDELWTETGSSSGWWLWVKNSASLMYVAIHEIGHALGLQHSDVSGSVMWPTAKTGNPNLHPDDINGIQSLYGGCS